MGKDGAVLFPVDGNPAFSGADCVCLRLWPPDRSSGAVGRTPPALVEQPVETAADELSA